MMAAKAKRQREKAKKAAEKMAMPAKNEPNLLDNADFRKTLIQQLDDKRQERQQGKWCLPQVWSFLGSKHSLIDMLAVMICENSMYI